MIRFAMLLLFVTAAIAAPADGPYVETWPDGNKKVEGRYLNGKRQGTWRAWYENGQEKSVERFDQGRWHGRRAEWFENGQLRLDWEYREGKLAPGAWKSWHANGAFHTSFKMGKKGKPPTQVQVAYYDNGEVEYRGRWKNGLQDGKWVYFYPDGGKKEVRPYRKGQLDGTLKRWNEEGVLVEQTEYRNGRRK